MGHDVEAIIALQRPLDLDITHDELADFDLRFRLILRKHLVILGWWSLLNVTGGIFALLFLKGTAYYFWMMRIIWGLINFIIVMAILNHTFYLHLCSNQLSAEVSTLVTFIPTR